MEASFHHLEFREIVDKFWKAAPGNLAETMNLFKEYEWEWNKESFGNIFRRKKRCKARLMGCMRRWRGQIDNP